MKTSHKIYIALAVIVLLALPTVVWAINVATSDVRGKGNAVMQKNSATNRIAKQELFEELHAEVLSADQRIAVLAAAAKASPSEVNQTNLTGAMTYCLSVAADYNAEARKYTAADFRAVDLPAQIDTLNPTTDCKE